MWLGFQVAGNLALAMELLPRIRQTQRYVLGGGGNKRYNVDRARSFEAQLKVPQEGFEPTTRQLTPIVLVLDWFRRCQRSKHAEAHPQSEVRQSVTG